MRKLLILLGIIILGIIIGSQAHDYRQNIEKQRNELNSVRVEKARIEKSLEVKQKELQDAQLQKAELEKKLQAKVTQRAVLAVAHNKAPQRTVAYNASNWAEQCRTWARQAGFELDNAAIKLLERESHCNPTAWNKSGAGGIPQALPFSKTGCQLSTAGAVCQLKWFRNYVFGRYGSFQNALNHSLKYNWY